MIKLLPALVALVLAGCQQRVDEELEADEAEVVDQEAAMGDEPMDEAHQTAMMACPMMVEDTTVEVEDTDDGVALVFSTTGDPGPLRERVERMGRMYEEHEAGQHMMWRHMDEMREGRMGGEHMGRDGMRGDQMGRDGMRGEHMGKDEMARMGKGEMMPAATVETEETEQGMRLVLRPKDEAQLDALRTRIHAHQQHMSQGQCWMAQEPPAEEPVPEGT